MPPCLAIALAFKDAWMEGDVSLTIASGERDLKDKDAADNETEAQMCSIILLTTSG